MSAIDVPSELIKPLQQLAVERGQSVAAIVEQLIADYLREQRHRYLVAEMERFRHLHADLRQQFEGQYVALRDGQVLDHDGDGGILYGRLRERYGDLPILIVQVTDQPEQLFTRLGSRVST
jgi:hypothetical protein